MKLSIIVLLFGLLLPARMVLAQGKSQSGNAHQFAVLLDGPIAFNEDGFSVDLYSVNGGARIGTMTISGNGCVSFAADVLSPPPFLQPCESPPALAHDQLYYENQTLTFELPGGTITASERGWEVYNSNPPVNGGDRSVTGIREGPITGGTGKYANAQGEFFGRLNAEVIWLEEFQVGQPYWFARSVLVFQLR